MKILLVHNYYSQYGGEDSYFDKLTAILNKKPHKISIYKASSGTFNSPFKKVQALAPLFAPGKQYGELSKIIETSRPDVVHFNNIYPMIGPSVYRLFSKNTIPIVQSIHNYRLLPSKESLFGYDNYRSPLYKRILRAAITGAAKNGLYDLVDCFVFPTKFAKKTYIENAPFRMKGHKVIPNFVDTGKTAGRRRKSDYFLFAGRLSKEKGILPLLDIFASLSHQKLIVIGDGPDKKKVLSYRKFGNIKILGWKDRNATHKLMAQARALISPSLSYEVMPLGVIESLALKTPVIVPKKASFKEIIKRKNDAVFYEDDDFSDLKSKITGFDDNRRVVTDYSELYSPDRHYKSLINLYNQLI